MRRYDGWRVVYNVRHVYCKQPDASIPAWGYYNAQENGFDEMVKDISNERRVIRDGLSEELLGILVQATSYVNEMDIPENQRTDFKVAQTQVEILHNRLRQIEERIETVLEAGKRDEATELMREALTVREELLLWMTRGFSRIVQVFLPVLFPERESSH